MRLWHFLILLLAVCCAGGTNSDRASESPSTKEKGKVDLHGSSLPPGALVRLGTCKLLHSRWVTAVQFSQDGRFLASSGQEGVVRVWQRTSGQPLFAFKTNQGGNQVLTFSADSRFLAFVYQERAVHVVDLSSGAVVCRAGGRGNPIGTIALSPNGRLLAYGQGPGIHLWDLKRGKEKWFLQGHHDAVASVVFSAGGLFLVSVSEDKIMCRWDTQSGKQLQRVPLRGLEDSSSPALSLTLDPEGRRIAVVCANGTVCLCNSRTGRLVHHFPGRMQRVAFRPDGNQILTRDEEAIGVWEIGSGKQCGVVKVSTRMARCEALSPDGKTLVLGGHDGRIRLWDLCSGKLKPRPPEHRSRVDAVTFFADGRSLATISPDKSLRLWDALSGKQRLCLTETSKGPYLVRATLVASTDDQTVIATRAGDEICFWDRATGAVKRRLHFPDCRISDFALSRNGRWAATETSDATAGPHLELWNLSTNKKHRLWTRANEPGPWFVQATGSCIAFSPDGKILAASCSTRSIRLFDVATRKSLYILPAQTAMVSSLAFASDGSVLLSAGGQEARVAVDPDVRVWDVATGQLLGTVPLAFPALPFSLAVSPVGDCFACGDRSGGVHVYELASLKAILRFQGEPTTKVYSVAFAPAGDRLASGFSDGTTLIWDLNPFHPRSVVAPPTPQQFAALWADLRASDARVAYRAVWTLARAPKMSVTFLQRRLRPVPGPMPETIRRLVADLDHDLFARREKASRELACLGSQAVPELRRALLNSKISPESRARIAPLMRAVDPWVVSDPETLRTLRAVWVLERIGTKESQQLLQRLGNGAPAARQTIAAKAALRRLQRRRASP